MCMLGKTTSTHGHYLTNRPSRWTVLKTAFPLAIRSSSVRVLPPHQSRLKTSSKLRGEAGQTEQQRELTSFISFSCHFLLYRAVNQLPKNLPDFYNTNQVRNSHSKSDSSKFNFASRTQYISMQYLNIVSSLIQILVDANYIMFSLLHNSYHSMHLLGTYGHRWQRGAHLESVLEGCIRVNKGRQREDKGILKPGKEQREVNIVGGCGICSLAASKGKTEEWDAHKWGLQFLFLVWMPSLSPFPLCFREGSVSSLVSTYVKKPGS